MYRSKKIPFCNDKHNVHTRLCGKNLDLTQSYLLNSPEQEEIGSFKKIRVSFTYPKLAKSTIRVLTFFYYNLTQDNVLGGNKHLFRFFKQLEVFFQLILYFP